MDNGAMGFKGEEYWTNYKDPSYNSMKEKLTEQFTFGLYIDVPTTLDLDTHLDMPIYGLRMDKKYNIYHYPNNRFVYAIVTTINSGEIFVERVMHPKGNLRKIVPRPIDSFKRGRSGGPISNTVKTIFPNLKLLNDEYFFRYIAFDKLSNVVQTTMTSKRELPKDIKNFNPDINRIPPSSVITSHKNNALTPPKEPGIEIKWDIETSKASNSKVLLHVAYSLPKTNGAVVTIEEGTYFKLPLVLTSSAISTPESFIVNVPVKKDDVELFTGTFTINLAAHSVLLHNDSEVVCIGLYMGMASEPVRLFVQP